VLSRVLGLRRQALNYSNDPFAMVGGGGGSFAAMGVEALDDSMTAQSGGLRSGMNVGDMLGDSERETAT
jgi:hypothetical protein